MTPRHLLFLVTMRAVITVHAPDRVGDLDENQIRSYVEQDQMASQEAILDIVGQCWQGGENSSGHRRVRFSVRVN